MQKLKRNKSHLKLETFHDTLKIAKGILLLFLVSIGFFYFIIIN
jgi:hypothetical protein